VQQETILLVQSSWQRVATQPALVASHFYHSLFDADPSLSALFKSDISVQGQKLVQMIGVAVGKLHDLDTLVPVVQQLGRRHAEYGVQDAHYTTVGIALLSTLRHALAEDFTPEVETAWAQTYGLLAGTMMGAAAATRSVSQ